MAIISDETEENNGWKKLTPRSLVRAWDNEDSTWDKRSKKY